VILYCATTNPGKLREFQMAAETAGPVQFIPITTIAPSPETGATFEENAVQKALHYAPHAPGLLFAEDSGLEVEALGGAPGIHSARFAGEGASDEQNNRLLIERLRGVEDRNARYVCVIALADAHRIVRTFRGEVRGRIVDSPRGNGGFGYDPHFFYEPFGCTFAEATVEQKFSVSHRGVALRKMLEFIFKKSG
jgi:XTP/dITP diphosphohydrolase